MDEQKVLNRPRSVFVVCESGSDIRLLIEILRQAGLRTLNNDALLEPGMSIATTTQDLIAQADVVCALLKQHNSPDVYFELGYAIGQNRPVAVIGDAATLPTDMLDTFWIKASLEDHDALSFQLRAFIANLDTHDPARAKSTPSPTKRSTPGRKLKSGGQPGLGLEFEVLEALQASAEIDSIAPQPSAGDRRGYVPDFAVWLTAASTVLESPVVIEVKSHRAGSAAIRQAVEQLIRFSRAGDIRTGLIIGGGEFDEKLRLASLSPLIFVLAFEEAKELLAQGKLVETLRRERNRVMHSAG